MYRSGSLKYQEHVIPAAERLGNFNSVLLHLGNRYAGKPRHFPGMGGQNDKGRFLRQQQLWLL